MQKLKRYAIFTAGLFILSLGVSLVTRASLGTAPISAVPYVLSLGFPLSFGVFTVLFSVLLLAGQLVILGRRFKPEGFLQLPVSVLFGYFIDCTMSLFSWLRPADYVSQAVCLLIGCAVLAFGVWLEVVADVVMLPGEAFVRAVVIRWHTEFAVTKVIFDSSVVAAAVILSFALFGSFKGLREGTVAVALLNGTILRLYRKLFSPLEKALVRENPVCAEAE